ncbi:MAG: hypothetical protein VXW73_05790 [Actinomycetota bacterium]|nr:hypothetical protein [Actinomycetota bacterium]
MAYLRLQQPLRGVTDVVSYRAQSSDYTKKCLNVAPFDVYEGRLRVGSRQGFCALADFADGAASSAIQGMLPYKVYRGGTLIQQILIIQNGKIFDCNSSGSSRTEIAKTDTSNHFGDGSNPIDATLQPSANLSTSAKVEMVQYRNYAYIVDGTSYFQIDLRKSHGAPSARIGIEHWSEKNSSGTQIAHNGAGGARIAGATLIEVWGARVVLAGFTSTPNVWTASTVGDANDWHPDASSASKGIASGTSPEFAILGDQITALQVFGSSGLLIACRDSMTYMTTDPIYTNARMEQISREVGCLGPRAMCGGPEKSVFFVGSDGVYNARPNDFDINRGNRISTGALDQLFERTDPDDLSAAVIVYDEGRQTVTTLLSRNESFSSVHAMYDISTQSWWPFQIADTTNNNPTVAAVFKPLLEERQTIWYGGPNGRISVQPVAGAFHSDGMKVTDANSWAVTETVTAFESRVLIGPINEDPSQRLLLRDIRVILQDNQEVLNVGASTSGYPTTAQILSGSGYATKADISTLSKPTLASEQTGNIATIEVFDIDAVQKQDKANSGTVVTDGILSTHDDATGASVSLDQVPGTSDTTIDGGAASTSYSATARLYGIGAFPPTGTYLQLTTDAAPVLYGPGTWVIYYEEATTKWKVSYDGVVLFESDAVSQLPTSISDVDITAGTLTSTIITTGGAGSDASDPLLTSDLTASRNNAIRTRLRSPDFFFQISATGRSWALEDISVDVVPGGPFRKVSS